MENISKKIGSMVTVNKFGQVVCKHAWTSFDLAPTGAVTPCCYFPGKIMGNINENSIEEIWNGEKFQKFREEMSKNGAAKVCPPCAIMAGMKHWETLDWYRELDKNSPVYKNAELNEREIFNGKIKLESNIRRLKYIPSYQCNLRCYHCNQDQYRRRGFTRLGKGVFDKVMKIFPTLQIINPFGGEPFIFSETNKFLQAIIHINPACRLYTTTNANKIDEETFRLLGRVNIIKLAVSLDGFTKASYEKFRVGANWEILIKNIERLAELKKTRFFPLVFNASFNNQTYKELPIFMDLCRKYGAIGKVNFVQRKANHTLAFWRRYLKMSQGQIKEFLGLIEAELADQNLPIDARNSLINLKKVLKTYPFNEFDLLKNNLRNYLINWLKRLGLFASAQRLYILIKK